MGRVIDVDKKELEWSGKIAELKEIVKKCDEAIQLEQEKKQKANEEIDKHNRFIQTVREMYGDLPKFDLVEEKPASDSLKGLTLSEAIMTVFESEPLKKFTGLELTDILLKRGYKSKSDDFRTIVYNTLRRLSGKSIEVDSRGFKHYYTLKEKNEMKSLLN